MTFREKLEASSRARNSLLCVGLDPDPAYLDGKRTTGFLRDIVDATKDIVCAYKPNLAFFEALGPAGMALLQDILNGIPDDVVVIGDGKRGDIGNTAAKYANALFDVYGFDAATVNPYLGHDALEPFLTYEDKGIIVVCRTSNPGARDIQDLSVDGTPLYQIVAQKARDEWNSRDNVALVVGATYPEDGRLLREMCPDMPFLVPGIGAQQGELEEAVTSTVNASGELAIVNASRGVLYADRGERFAEAARTAAIDYRDRINRARASLAAPR